ncbi:MAG: plasmid pRiA4b ORF-3 family protein [Deltaproteobacteria bacterium]|nr:plasmid pRiA4b ORF-3 family protein [Deltaproteobacteria bacterium]
MAKVLQGDFTRKKKRMAKKGTEKIAVPGYQLKISITFSDPLIWRRILVPGSMTLASLHRAIQVCMGWSDSDTHQFLVGKIFYQTGFGIENMKKKPEYDEANYKLYQLEESMQFIFTYLYDGGEGWELELTLEDVLPQGCKEKHPVLLDGALGCPPQEVGDIHQYQALLDEFERSGDDSQEYLAIPDGPDFYPEVFDIDVINDRLRDII